VPRRRAGARGAVGGRERVTVDVLPSGHWVHVDDPGGLLRSLLRYIND